MKLLLISTDRNLLQPDSAVSIRHAAYATRCASLAIIVFSKRGAEPVMLAPSATVHPTNSRTKLLYGLDAILIACGLSKPDVVSAQDPFETGLAAWVVARLFNVPLHVQIHTDFLAPEFVQGFFLNRLRRFIAEFVLRRASRVRAVSERIKESLEKQYRLSAPISVLPIYVDIGRYAHIVRTKHPRFKVVLLTISRLEKEKHLSRAIDALQKARTTGHDAGLIIVGSGSEEGRLRDYAREKSLERFVEFAGWQNDLAPYFSVADLVLVTSDYEGYGITIITALASGIPVLSTDVGVAREAGAMVASPEDFAQALVRWIAGGPRKGDLVAYPYTNEGEYVRAWYDDIASCTSAKKRV